MTGRAGGAVQASLATLRKGSQSAGAARFACRFYNSRISAAR